MINLDWNKIGKVITIIAGLFLLYHFWDTECDGRNHKKSPDTLTVYKFKVDTVVEIRDRPPLIGQGNAKIIYRDRYINLSNSTGLIDNSITRQDSAKSDTTDNCYPRPFIAVLDTVQGKDSAHLEYLYPESIFRYSIFHKPDTLIVYDTTKTITNTINTIEERPWYTQPMAVTGFTLTVVILLSRLLK